MTKSSNVCQTVMEAVTANDSTADSRRCKMDLIDEDLQINRN